jgi:hypothetical protein
MGILLKIECDGEIQNVEVTGSGDLVFEEFDIEDALVLVEMGYEPDLCAKTYLKWQTNPFKTLFALFRWEDNEYWTSGPWYDIKAETGFIWVKRALTILKKIGSPPFVVAHPIASYFRGGEDEPDYYQVDPVEWVEGLKEIYGELYDFDPDLGTDDRKAKRDLEKHNRFMGRAVSDANFEQSEKNDIPWKTDYSRYPQFVLKARFYAASALFALGQMIRNDNDARLERAHSNFEEIQKYIGLAAIYEAALDGATKSEAADFSYETRRQLIGQFVQVLERRHS